MEVLSDLMFSKDFDGKIEYIQLIHSDLLNVEKNAKMAFDKKELKEYMSELVEEEKLLEAFKLRTFILRARFKHHAAMILYYTYFNKQNDLEKEIEDFKSFGSEMTKFYEGLEMENKSKIKLEFDKNGESQIHLAAKNGHAISVEFYVRIFGEKANPERKKIRWLRGGTEELKKLTYLTPMHEALDNGYLDVFGTLAKKSASEYLKKFLMNYEIKVWSFVPFQHGETKLNKTGIQQC